MATYDAPNAIPAAPGKPTRPGDSTTPGDPVNYRALATHQSTQQPTHQRTLGKLFRSDDLSVASDEFIANMLEHDGVTTVIDFRSCVEVAATGRGPLVFQPVSYHHLPFQDLQVPSEAMNPAELQRMLNMDADQMGALYFRWLSENVSQVVTGLHVLLAAPGAVVFHCTAGKDRTGIFAAVVLSLLGANADAIADEYARSRDVLPQVHRRVFHILRPLIEHVSDQLEAAKLPDAGSLPMLGMLGAERENILIFLQLVEQNFGGLDRLLNAHGWAPQLTRMLAEKYGAAA